LIIIFNKLDYYTILQFSLLSIGLFSTVAIAAALTKSSISKNPANYFLLAHVIIEGIAIFMIFSIKTEFIKEIPWLYRVPRPFYLLNYPFVYFYLRKTLLDNHKLYRIDFLHALPFVLYIIYCLPYYLSSMDFKIQVVNAVVANPYVAHANGEGIISTKLFSSGRLIQAIIYAILIWRIIIKWKNQESIKLNSYYELNNWVTVFGFLVLLTPFSILFNLINIFNFSQTSRETVLIGAMALNQIILCFMMYYYPTIQFGLPRFIKLIDDDVKSEPIEKMSKKIIFNEDIFENYKERLNRIMEHKKVYLSPKYTATDLAKEMGIPQYHLTYYLNNYLGSSFSNYINSQRIFHIKNRIDNGELKGLTLEAIALESGFSSRINFIKVVQRLTGKNPSSYFSLSLDEKCNDLTN
jgi:AraC-like DNA-binding protein